MVSSRWAGREVILYRSAIPARTGRTTVPGRPKASMPDLTRPRDAARCGGELLPLISDELRELAAAALEISLRTADADWAYARTWLVALREGD